MSQPNFIVKDATATDFGLSYDDSKDSAMWPRPYLSYNSHDGFNAELSRIADVTEVKSKDGSLVAHTATFQPFKAPKPGAKPSEDRHVFQIWDLPTGSWTFAAIFDGHAGLEISEYAHVEVPIRVRHALEVVSASNIAPQVISSLLTKVIEDFDRSISDDLIALIPKNFEELDDGALKKLVNDQKSGGKVYNACIRCMRGSTALLALIDPLKQNLWVANLGDCQATLVEYMVEKSASFKETILTSPHNARVTSEVDRIRSEHPGEPEVILRDRVLGAIAVSRALGDFTFKLPAAYTTKLFLNANPGYRISTKVSDFLPRNLTPPYVSGTPEITHRSLQTSAIGNEKTKHVLAMCSDGVTDLYLERKWTTENAARRIAEICVNFKGEQWDGLHGNLALHMSKDALGDDLEEQCRMLTADLDFQHLDDTTSVVISW